MIFKEGDILEFKRPLPLTNEEVTEEYWVVEEYVDCITWVRLSCFDGHSISYPPLIHSSLRY